jgi:hypothetical protein
MAQAVDPSPPLGVPVAPCQPVDNARGRPGTPDAREPSAHGRFIREPPRDDGPQLLPPGARPRRDPGVTIVTVAVTDHAAKGVDVVIRAGEDGIEAEEMRQEGPSTGTLHRRWRAP